MASPVSFDIDADVFVQLSSTRVSEENLRIPTSLGNLEVRHNGRDFFVINERAESFLIPRANLSSELRGISASELQKSLSVGYLRLKKSGEEYGLELNYRLPGGGPLAGWIGYWGTKAICYGAAIAAGAAAVITTGGAIAGAGGTALTGGLVATASTTTGTAFVAGAIGSLPSATLLATEATVATVSSAGGVAGAVTAVESAAGFIGTGLLCCPWLP
ncbi:MAG: hypothetical protein HYX48_00375 [Chlamydiales bacterium]|nr:hypothetical protein [Chlamydiales bacterium]